MGAHTLTIYPAIDLRGGRVVRLVEGDPGRQTVHSDDPIATAQRWQAAGAEWLHVVNLDGALGEAGPNRALLPRLASLGLPVQFGGGLRSLDDAERALEAGAARVVLGTLIVQEPALAAEAVQRFGAEAVAAALDAREGRVALHGWQATSRWTPAELGSTLAGMGIRHALYTDVRRDGGLQGVAAAETAALARATGLQVIASGGVASLEDVRALIDAGDIAGVVIGRALYEGALALEDALRLARQR